MIDGKKSTRRAHCLWCFDKIQTRQAQIPVGECSTKRLKTFKPAVEVRSRRVGGATYQVPVEVRQIAPGFGLRWLWCLRGP